MIVKEGEPVRQSLVQRIFNPGTGSMLVRNTVVSTGTFLFGLALMTAMIEWGGADQTIAAGASFMVATSIHYIFGRVWIFSGTERPVVSGYAYFLINALVGLIATMTLFEWLTHILPAHYVVSRIIASLFAGLAMFLSNAMLNFRQV